MQLLKHLLLRTREYTWRAEIETSNKGLQLIVAVKKQLACSLLCVYNALLFRECCSDKQISDSITCPHLLGLAKTSSVSFHMLKWTGSNVIWATSGTWTCYYCCSATADVHEVALLMLLVCTWLRQITVNLLSIYFAAAKVCARVLRRVSKSQ